MQSQSSSSSWNSSIYQILHDVTSQALSVKRLRDRARVVTSDPNSADMWRCWTCPNSDFMYIIGKRHDNGKWYFISKDQDLLVLKEMESEPNHNVDMSDERLFSYKRLLQNGRHVLKHVTTSQYLNFDSDRIAFSNNPDEASHWSFQ